MPPQSREVHNVVVDEPTTNLSRVTSMGDMSIASSVESPKNANDYRIRKTSVLKMINWTHVLGTHLPLIMKFGVLILIAQIFNQAAADLDLQQFELTSITQIIIAVKDLLVDVYEGMIQDSSRGISLLSPAVKITILLLFIGAYLMRSENPVYLLSFATFKPPDSWKCSHDQIMEIMRRQGCFNADSLSFLQKILERSGTGHATAWPPGIVQCLDEGSPKSSRSMQSSREESEAIIFEIVAEALKKANVKPREIDILIINCSLFSPTPSLCAMVMHHFNMRSDVATFNLSGMGCAASLISVDLAKQLLASRGARKALVVSTEILTPNFYHGNERGFLIQNTLFRCGGAAMVLSNSWGDGRRALFKLLHTVRVQGTGDAAFDCVYETEDEKGERGVRLSKDIVKVAGKCMEKNFTMLGPLILVWTEQALVVWSVIARFVLKSLSKILLANKMEEWANSLPTVKPYVPDFKGSIDHFCIHAGGRAVIDGIEKNMKLAHFHTEASRMTLYNYGNTSSSSIWYELEYIMDTQQNNPLKKGDRVLQIAFGSGFKCTSAVWLKL